MLPNEDTDSIYATFDGWNLPYYSRDKYYDPPNIIVNIYLLENDSSAIFIDSVSVIWSRKQ